MQTHLTKNIISNRGNIQTTLKSHPQGGGTVFISPSLPFKVINPMIYSKIIPTIATIFEIFFPEKEKTWHALPQDNVAIIPPLMCYQHVQKFTINYTCQNYNSASQVTRTLTMTCYQLLYYIIKAGNICSL